jgi:hypothetical protein
LIDDAESETRVFSTRTPLEVEASRAFRTPFPLPKTQSLSDLFYGPDLHYSAAIDSNDTTGNKVHLQQWEQLTNFPHGGDNSTTFTFGKK